MIVPALVELISVPVVERTPTPSNVPPVTTAFELQDAPVGRGIGPRPRARPSEAQGLPAHVAADRPVVGEGDLESSEAGDQIVLVRRWLPPTSIDSSRLSSPPASTVPPPANVAGPEVVIGHDPIVRHPSQSQQPAVLNRPHQPQVIAEALQPP